MSGRGLAILTRRHPGVELLIKRAHSRPEGWLSVEAYDTLKGADRPRFHRYLVDPTGRVWTSPDGERREVELRTAAYGLGSLREPLPPVDRLGSPEWQVPR